jgi:hypothetical protein
MLINETSVYNFFVSPDAGSTSHARETVQVLLWPSCRLRPRRGVELRTLTWLHALPGDFQAHVILKQGPTCLTL